MRGVIRRWWQGLVFAAAISFAQFHDDRDFDIRAMDRYPYVRMVNMGDWVTRERIGTTILTLPYEPRQTMSLN